MPYDALDSLALDLALAGAALRCAIRASTDRSRSSSISRSPLPRSAGARSTLDLSDAFRGREVERRSRSPPVCGSGGDEILGTDRVGRDRLREPAASCNNINELAAPGRGRRRRRASTVTSSSFDLKGWSATRCPRSPPYEPEGDRRLRGLLARAERRGAGSFRRAHRAAERRPVAAGCRDGSGCGGVGVGAGERIEAERLHGDDPRADPRPSRAVSRIRSSAAKFELAAHSIGEAEANDLISGLTSVRDTVFGALRFDAQLAGMAGGEAQSLRHARRIRAIHDRRERRGAAARRLAAAHDARADSAPRWCDAARAKLRAQPAERRTIWARSFDLVEGDLDDRRPARSTRATLRMRYRGYEARLTGRMQLADLGARHARRAAARFSARRRARGSAGQRARGSCAGPDSARPRHEHALGPEGLTHGRDARRRAEAPLAHDGRRPDASARRSAMRSAMSLEKSATRSVGSLGSRAGI